MSMPESFTRMDHSTQTQWAHIAREHVRHMPRVADRVLAELRSLRDVEDGFAVDQLTHSLQTATRAERDGADGELVVASLCHDIGKAISVMNHAAIAAEILRPYVREELYHVIRTHQDFQGRHYYAYMGKDPDARAQYRGQPWFALGERFADEWDQRAFDPAYDTLPLDHFAPLVREIFAQPRNF
jgi:predicted HD phosphohydrolase